MVRMYYHVDLSLASLFHLSLPLLLTILLPWSPHNNRRRSYSIFILLLLLLGRNKSIFTLVTSISLQHPQFCIFFLSFKPTTKGVSGTCRRSFSFSIPFCNYVKERRKYLPSCASLSKHLNSKILQNFNQASVNGNTQFPLAGKSDRFEIVEADLGAISILSFIFLLIRIGLWLSLTSVGVIIVSSVPFLASLSHMSSFTHQGMWTVLIDISQILFWLPFSSTIRLPFRAARWRWKVDENIRRLFTKLCSVISPVLHLRYSCWSL